jgi:hypothetical protein
MCQPNVPLPIRHATTAKPFRRLEQAPPLLKP